MFLKLKSFLGRFVPVPSRTFHRKMEEIQNKQQEIQDKHNRDIGEIKSILRDLNQKTDNAIMVSNDIKKATGDIGKATEDIKKKTDNIDKATGGIGKTAEELKKKTNDIDKAAGSIGKTTEELKKKVDNIDKTASTIIKTTEDVKKIGNEIKGNSSKTDRRIIDFEIKFLRVQQKPRLDYFVLNILNHCNLNCKGCDHFAPIANPYLVSLKNIKNDLQQMSKLTDKNVSEIGIMGGEPLLHPDLLEIMEIARKEFPKTIIRIVTNGILLLKQDELFWNVCRDNEITIDVTKYPIQLDFDKMIQTAQSKNVQFQFYGSTGEKEKTLYKTPLDIKGTQDAKRSFFNCFQVNKCIFLMEGKLYPCTPMPNTTHLNKRFNLSLVLEKSDYLDIYSVNTIDEILSFISKPKPFCRYCKTTERTTGHPWERSTQDINEWI